VPELVAIDLPGGPRFTHVLEAAWDAGDAVAPIDPRLPPRVRRELVHALAPTVMISSDGDATKLGGGRPVEEGDAVVIATSGSTGAPRGVVLTRAAVEASAYATSARLGVDPGRHRWLACLPLAHIGGLSVLMRALVTGTPCTVVPGFDAATVTAIARRGEATHVSLVATALGRIEPGLFARILLGGAAPPDGLPANVVTTYGMTETGSGVVYDGVPLDGVDVAIGTGQDGQGRDGEVLLRGPMLLRAYRDGTDPTIPGPDHEGGWLPTGDAGRLDDGRLVVHGRMAEVITTGGEKVWPVPVEQAIATLPEVAEVAVWRRADPEWGQRVVAWVVPRDPSAPPALGALVEAVRETLPPWAAPKELVLTDRLPRTASGKVRRAALG
jgi:O-succinylbenzoic acid--CoA ligase